MPLKLATSIAKVKPFGLLRQYLQQIPNIENTNTEANAARLRLRLGTNFANLATQHPNNRKPSIRKPTMNTLTNIAKTRMISQMAGLNHHKNSIFQLQSVWDNLSLLAQLSGTGTDMTQTRSAFAQVTNNVLENLASEMLNKTVKALTSKAFVIINIVIRNLFERTADIGFLSTDDDIRDFLEKHHQEQSTQNDIDQLRVRFEEYIKKYSVYDNIMLLDPTGKVLVQLDPHNRVQHASDALIAEALTTSAPYVEIYRHSDLIPHQDNSLIYAYRVTSANENKVLGVLCLCFRFENEMQAVFKNLISSNDWTVGVMLNANQEVIASSDVYQIPVGAKLEVTKKGIDWLLTRFAGREYITVSRKTSGYQGYMGPGWIGHAMIPLAHAFDRAHEAEIHNVDPQLLAKVMRSPLIFSQNLLDIPKKAAVIQSKLNQSVWNGNIWQTNEARSSDMQSNQSKFSKSLLWEISNTGFKTQHIIEKTVTELYQTVVSILLENSRFFAFLAVDIMDRNLYERANDCRWWALTLTFRKMLEKTEKSSGDIHQLEKILKYINGLYTVYDNLVIFDRQGNILAVSNPAYRDCVGTLIESEWITRLRGLSTSQDYLVSKFEPTPLYKNKSTYIYAAAIRATDNNSIVGGIGIVFDSTPQFSAILHDVSPRNDKGQPISGSFTLFVDGDLQVIASTHPEMPIGSTFTIHPNLCKLSPGESKFDIAMYDGQYFAIGAFASAGYREFKGTHDAYKNQMTSMIFIPLGRATEIDALIAADNALQHNAFKISTAVSGNAHAVEYATFYVGKDWFGIPATEVAEAIEPTNIRSIPESADTYEGLLNYKNVVIPIFNISKALTTQTGVQSKNQQIIVLKAAEQSPQFGILISALGEIPSIDPSKIEPNTNIFSSNSSRLSVGITTIVTDQSQTSMLTILSAESIWRKLNPTKKSEALQTRA